MVRIRLKRIGAKKAPFYRIVVMPARSPRDGRAIEEIGTYDPRSSPSVVTVKRGRARYWLKCGAQPSEIVQNLLRKGGVFNPDLPDEDVVDEPVAAASEDAGASSGSPDPVPAEAVAE